MKALRRAAWGMSLLLGVAMLGTFNAPAHAQGQNGTTLTAYKTATGFSEVIYPWTIDKSVNPEVIDMFEGDTATVEYIVSVEKGAPVQRTGVTGEVCVFNGGAVATDNLKIVDAVYGHPRNKTPLFYVDVDTSLWPVLQPSERFCYPYSYEIDAAVGQTVKDDARVTITNHSGWLGKPFGATPSATATIPQPTIIDAAITVDDSLGMSWDFDKSGSVGYPATFDSAGVYENTATIRSTGQSSSASVTVNSYAIEVAKTAGTSWDRDWTWKIDKSVDQPELSLAVGEAANVNWTVALSPASTDSGYAVTGTITVTNPAPIAASLVSVTDSFGELGIEVSCPDMSVAAHSSVECSYSAALDGPVDGLNVATATLQNHDWAADGSATATGTSDYQGSADVVFSALPTNETDECVVVSDTLAGELGQLCVGDANQTFTYSTQVGPYQYPGSYTVDNVAGFVTNDTGTTGTDDATVIVTVPELTGCTLTQGYWQTHSRQGPAPYDPAWQNLGDLEEATLFFNSGQSWLEVFKTAPQGNAYYILAVQYMAGTLNVLNGASSTPEVSQALADAEALFASAAGPEFAPEQRARAIELGTLLDQYNNGLIGPAHCS